MKTRKVITIIGIALALIIMLAALPSQAQSNSINNLKFAVLTGRNIPGIGSNTVWELSWSNLPNQDGAIAQFKGGGITSVWTSLNNSSINIGPQRTNIAFAPLTNSPSGKTFKFRVKVSTCTVNGNVTSCAPTAWAYVDKTFN